MVGDHAGSIEGVGDGWHQSNAPRVSYPRIVRGC